MERAIAGAIWCVRHGETEWSASGRHTGRTDVALTDAGRAAASALAPALAGRRFALVVCSPMARARETAALAGFPDAELCPDAVEWDYGDFEGVTTAEIQARGGTFTDWTVWSGPMPGGETIDAVAARARTLLARCDAAGGDVLCFAHGHFLRIFTALALGFEPRDGARFALDPATLNVIGSEHGVRALRLWNAPPAEFAAGAPGMPT